MVGIIIVHVLMDNGRYNGSTVDLRVKDTLELSFV